MDGLSVVPTAKPKALFFCEHVMWNYLASYLLMWSHFGAELGLETENWAFQLHFVGTCSLYEESVLSLFSDTLYRVF